MFLKRFLLDEFPALCYSISRGLSGKTTKECGKIENNNERRSAALTKSRSQMMVERLRDLQASSPDIEASAVVSVDGLTIASALPQGVEEDRVSAMSAAMLSLGERIASELGRGSLDQVYIKGEQGYVVLMSVGEEAVLTALAREQAKLGLIFLDMRRATEDLEKLI
jgi:uncharacterized protein